jgi:hypothetical protein
MQLPYEKRLDGFMQPSLPAHFNCQTYKNVNLVTGMTIWINRKGKSLPEYSNLIGN